MTFLSYKKPYQTFLKNTRLVNADHSEDIGVLMKTVIKLFLCVIFLLPYHAQAELPQQIKDDFAPLTGVVIMPVGDQYLIDLDATSGLNEGDILSLTVPGEKVVHPVTKEILGTLDVVRGYLKVTQIKSGYSYADLITAQVEPQKGAQVKRFEQVPVLFSGAGQNSILAAELKTGLPHLNWLDTGSTDIPQLTFSVEGSKLLIKNVEGVSIQDYQYDAGKLSALPSASIVQNTFKIGSEAKEKKSTLNQAVDNLLGSVGIGGKDDRLENPGIIRSRQESGAIWMGPNLKGNPVGIATADFDNDGQMETAVAMEDHIQILRIQQGQLAQVDKVEFSGGLHALSLDSLDMDGNGSPELYLSANNGIEVRSIVIEYINGSYAITLSRIPWLLRVVDLPGRGPSLIGQLVDSAEEPFSVPASALKREGDKLVKTDNITTPKDSFFSFAHLTDNSDSQLLAYVSPSDYLNVATGQRLKQWESSDNYGGSEEFFYNRKEKHTDDLQPIYIQKRLIKLPSGEVLVAQNEGTRVLQRYRNFTKSNVTAFRWDGYSLVETWRTSRQNGYLADFTVADADNDGQDELVMAVKFSNKNILQKGRSTVVIYELSK